MDSCFEVFRQQWGSSADLTEPMARVQHLQESSNGDTFALGVFAYICVIKKNKQTKNFFFAISVRGKQTERLSSKPVG